MLWGIGPIVVAPLFPLHLSHVVGLNPNPTIGSINDLLPPGTHVQETMIVATSQSTVQ
jgi:hypothetical protein